MRMYEDMLIGVSGEIILKLSYNNNIIKTYMFSALKSSVCWKWWSMCESNTQWWENIFAFKQGRSDFVKERTECLNYSNLLSFWTRYCLQKVTFYRFHHNLLRIFILKLCRRFHHHLLCYVSSIKRKPE